MTTTFDAPPHKSTASTVRDARRAEVDRRLRRVTGAPLHTGNQLRLLQNGSETYDDWFAAIGQARHWIHVENYIFRNDAIGTRFADVLAERAAAGVAVRVLVDWYGSMDVPRSEEHTSELQSRQYLVCRLLLEKKQQ